MKVKMNGIKGRSALKETRQCLSLGVFSRTFGKTTFPNLFSPGKTY